MRLRVWLSLILITLVGCGLAAVTSKGLRDTERATSEVEFQRIVDERVASFERELSLNIELLFAIHSLFEASDAVSHESFARVADGVLSRHPSVQALEWIPRIAESERRKAESSRRDLFPNFQITERVDGDTMIRAGRRDEYFPVYFVEPYEGNEAALGYDLASSPIRLAALRESRDEGSVRLTASVTLVQEQQSQLGFLGFVPVYSEKSNNVEERRRFLRGFALGVYRIGDIFEASALAQGVAGIDMILVDETTAGSPEVLYSHRSRSGEEPLDDISYRRSVKDLGARQWVLVASPTPMFFEGRKSALPILALAIGVLLTAGLVAYVLFQERRTLVVNALVHERTSEVETALERLETILGSIGQGVVVVDINNRVELVNEVAIEFLGVAGEDLIGKDFLSLIQDSSYIEMWKETANREEDLRKAELAVKSPVHRTLWTTRTRIGTASSAFRGYVTILHDVTKEQEVSRMKSDFVSSVSHELRTPLTNIKGFTDTILRDKAMTTDTRTEFLGIIRDETNRLASLIEDLLEISRIESGKVQVQLESLDISDIVKRTAESVGPQIIKNDLKLVCELHDSLPSPLGDVEKIQIVILNLLGNAIKFTSSEGTITLRAFSDDMYLVVQVEDTGMGIPPKDLARITDRFYRVHRPGTEIPGTGLGLSIVQELVNLHGGKLEVTSKVGEGSIFSVHLPLQRSAGGDDKTIHLETAQDA